MSIFQLFFPEKVQLIEMLGFTVIILFKLIFLNDQPNDTINWVKLKGKPWRSNNLSIKIKNLPNEIENIENIREIKNIKKTEMSENITG